MATLTSLAADWQKEIYLNGFAGKKPIVPTRFEVLEAQAQKVLSPRAFGYIAGGAGQGATIFRNREAFQQWKIVPRMLRDVSVRDTSCTLFGDLLPAPVLLSPIGVLELAHPQADLALAGAARKAGVPMIFSNQASYPMETCASVLGSSPHWFQLYWSKSDALVESLVKRAEACGCSAITVTLDTTMLGWRNIDLDQAYLPFLEGKGIAQYTSDPVFQQLVDHALQNPVPREKRPVTLRTLRGLFRLLKTYPGPWLENLRSGRALAAVQQFITLYSRPSLTWEDLALLRQFTKLPVLLKGILHPDDARKALDYGMDGIIISNHGGRQVDGAVATIEILPEIAAAVQGRVPVLIDSGIRTGADVFKAIALGATAVCLGRPYAYGLALAGAAGAYATIMHLLADFELTMGLAGCRSLAEITPEYLMKAND